MPERIQLRRTKGWRKPADAVVVARPSMWGNPFGERDFPPVAVTDGIPWEHQWREHAVHLYRHHLLAAITNPWSQPHTITFRNMADALDDLRDKDLACWCPLGLPCHADVLLAAANGRRPNHG